MNYCSPESSFELIRQTQREMREQAAKAQLIARARRESSGARSRSSGPFSWAARRVRATLARP